MPQLCVYLDDETMELLKAQAAKRGLSLSKCAAEDIRMCEQQNGGWPAYFTGLYGSIADPSFERFPQASQSVPKAAGSSARGRTAGAAASDSGSSAARDTGHVRGNHVRV